MSLSIFFIAWSQRPAGFVYLHGEPSTGKTYLAVCTLRRFAWSYRSPIRYVGHDLAARIREDLDSQFAGKFVRDLSGLKGLLLIDDLGTEGLKDLTREQIARIVYARYDNLYPTLITSNHNLAWVATNIDQRVADRILESDQVKQYLGPNRRIKP